MKKILVIHEDFHLIEGVQSGQFWKIEGDLTCERYDEDCRAEIRIVLKNGKEFNYCYTSLDDAEYDWKRILKEIEEFTG